MTRILPRSAKGTWLLAAAVWVGGCACFWVLLPVVPNSEIRLPGPQHLIGFGPGARTLLTCSPPDVPRDFSGLPGTVFNGPVGLWDASTGRLVSMLLKEETRINELKVSPDGTWLSAGVYTDTGAVLRLYELPTLSLVGEWPCEAISPGVNLGLYSSDSRWLVFRKRIGDAPADVRWIAWDLRDKGERPLQVRSLSLVVLKDAALATLADSTLGYATESENEFWNVPSPRFPNMVRLPDGGVIGFGSEGAVLPAVECGYVCLGQKKVLARRTPFGVAAKEELDDPEECREFILTNSGRYVLSLGRKEKLLRWWNRANGQVERSLAISDFDGFPSSLETVSSNNRTIIFGRPGEQSAVQVWLAAWMKPLARLFARHSELSGIALEIETGFHVATIPNYNHQSRWLPGGNSIAVPLDHGSLIQVWGIPPRKPLTWFTLEAAILAVPLAGLARRRSRRLRRDVAGKERCQEPFSGKGF